MPDWIAHILVAWICSKLFQMRFKKISDKQIILVMVGAVLPDIVAVNYLTSWIGINASGFLLPFHTPVGSMIVAAIVSLMFSKNSRALYLMIAGIATHFALDALLLHAGGGMVLLFPFSWTWGFQLNFIPSDSWIPVTIGVLAAALILTALKLKNKKNG